MAEKLGEGAGEVDVAASSGFAGTAFGVAAASAALGVGGAGGVGGAVGAVGQVFGGSHSVVVVVVVVLVRVMMAGCGEFDGVCRSCAVSSELVSDCSWKARELYMVRVLRYL